MARHLTAAGFDPLWVGKGEAGLARLRFERPDVCVLDLMLPGFDGWKLIETARREGIGTPIVVVSARGTEHDRVHALEIGADDYLVKPFSMKELVARVRAAARRGVRAQEEHRGEPIEIEELLVDPRNVQAYVDGENCELTPTEFRLLYALAMEQGRVVTRDELLQRIWGRSVRPAATGPSTSSSARLRAKVDRRREPAQLHPDPLRRRLQARGGPEAESPRPVGAGSHPARLMPCRPRVAPSGVHQPFTARSPSRHPTGGARGHHGSMPRVLIVEDDEVIAQGMARHLHGGGVRSVVGGEG